MREMCVLIVDDHSIVRESLDNIIRMELSNPVIVKAGNGKDCRDMITKFVFDMVVLDLGLPDQDGRDLIHSLLEADEELKILVFSMSPAAVYAPKLYEMGIYGFLSKQADLSEIRLAIRSIVVEGKRYVPNQLKQLAALTKEMESVDVLSLLSRREKSIAQFIVQGLSTSEIADKLGIRMSTVRTYKERIYTKFEVDSIYEFLTKAKLYGLE